MSARVVIVGGGFAGLFALRRLARRRDLDVTLLDPRGACDFLPLLPDTVGGRVDASRLRYDHAGLCRRLGCDLVAEAAVEIDLATPAATTSTGRRIEADYLLLCCGSETARPTGPLPDRALVLDSVADAVALRRTAADEPDRPVLVVGGGYTGVEVATNLRRRSTRRIVLAERGPAVVGRLPEPFRVYTADNLRRMDIEVRTGASADDVAAEPDLSDALVVWSAGVRTPEVIRRLDAPQTRQGRLCCDEFLRVADRVYVAGDVAELPASIGSVRMGIQFSISEAVRAAGSILSDLAGRPPKAFRPVDLGYVVPMANGRSCGRILGLPARGRVPTAMHYVMCVARSFGLSNRWGVLRDVLASLVRRG